MRRDLALQDKFVADVFQYQTHHQHIGHRVTTAVGMLLDAKAS